MRGEAPGPNEMMEVRLEGDQRLCVSATGTDKSSTDGTLEVPRGSTKQGLENVVLDAWLVESVVRMKEGQAAPLQESHYPVSPVCSQGDLEEDYKELSLLRIPSDEGVEAPERIWCASGKKLSNFIKNAGRERDAAPQGWEGMPWAVSWEDIVLSRDLENRIWTSKTATFWRAEMKKTRTRQGGRIALKQIYMDKHAEVSRCRGRACLSPSCSLSPSLPLCLSLEDPHTLSLAPSLHLFFCPSLHTLHPSLSLSLPPSSLPSLSSSL